MLNWLHEELELSDTDMPPKSITTTSSADAAAPSSPTTNQSTKSTAWADKGKEKEKVAENSSTAATETAETLKRRIQALELENSQLKASRAPPPRASTRPGAAASSSDDSSDDDGKGKRVSATSTKKGPKNWQPAPTDLVFSGNDPSKNNPRKFVEQADAFMRWDPFAPYASDTDNTRFFRSCLRGPALEWFDKDDLGLRIMRSNGYRAVCIALVDRFDNPLATQETVARLSSARAKSHGQVEAMTRQFQTDLLAIGAMSKITPYRELYLNALPADLRASLVLHGLPTDLLSLFTKACSLANILSQNNANDRARGRTSSSSSTTSSTTAGSQQQQRPRRAPFDESATCSRHGKGHSDANCLAQQREQRQQQSPAPAATPSPAPATTLGQMFANAQQQSKK